MFSMIKSYWGMCVNCAMITYFREAYMCLMGQNESILKWIGLQEWAIIMIKYCVISHPLSTMEYQMKNA